MATIGFTIPFQESTGSLGLFVATSDQISAAKQNLKSLLLTNWGERPMHYDMGCNMIEFLFQPMREGETDVLIADRIRSQVARWLPYLSVNDIKVSFSDDNSLRV